MSEVDDGSNTLESYRKDSKCGYIYSLPKGIEVMCAKEGEHGIIEVMCDNDGVHGFVDETSDRIGKSGLIEVASKRTDSFQLRRGCHTIVFGKHDANPVERSKGFRKERNRLEKNVASILKATEKGQFSIDFGRCEIRTRMINHVVSYLPNFCRPIVFQPFTFYENGMQSGGAYFTLSSTRPLTHKEDHVRCYVIKKLLTGMCLRPNMQMVTENGEYSDLVDILYLNVPQFGQKKIVGFEILDGVHPYETANLEMLRNLLPFFTALSQTHSTVVCFHLPLAEYLVHGVSIFLSGNITSEALDIYANILIKYASELRQKLSAIIHNKTIKFGSPLDILIQNIVILPEGSFARQFFHNLGVPFEQGKSGRNLEKEIAAVTLRYLKEQPGVPGAVWLKISEQALKDEKDISLKLLTDWSYSVKVAIQSYGSADNEVAVVDDSWERHITIAFKKYFSEQTWPSVLCFHWLMPLGMSHVSSLFFLPANPDTEICSIDEIRSMVHRSGKQIEKHMDSL